MAEFVDPVAFWGLLLVQLAGLASTVLGRLPSLGKSHEYCRGVYLGCLTVLAVATFAAIGMESSWWAWCGTTLSLMAVGGTLDWSGQISGSAF
jgi:hypothetical protein